MNFRDDNTTVPENLRGMPKGAEVIIKERGIRPGEGLRLDCMKKGSKKTTNIMAITALPAVSSLFNPTFMSRKAAYRWRLSAEDISVYSFLSTIVSLTGSSIFGVEQSGIPGKIASILGMPF